VESLVVEVRKDGASQAAAAGSTVPQYLLVSLASTDGSLFIPALISRPIPDVSVASSHWLLR
jgi:hypothetical protein